MDDVRVDAVDRLLAGDLSAAEQRQLAQAALDDADLFERLAAAAAADSVLGPPGERVGAIDGRAARRTSNRRLLGWFVAGCGLAASLLFAIAYFRSTSQIVEPPRAATNQSARHAVAERPILLTARAEPAAAQTFRAETVSSRIPNASGTVVAVRDGIVSVDLGSLDGLREGMDVHVARGGDRAAVVRITSVFRERARGRLLAAGDARPGDRVIVDPAVHVRALLDEAAARTAAGDSSAARTLVRLAVSAAGPPVAADLRRAALEQSGALEHQAGRLDEAGRALSSAVAEFGAAPAASTAERVDALNELGAIRIEQGDYAAAERTLHDAQAGATGAAKMRVTNNLGALAALRGDLAGAAALYRLARGAAGDAQAPAADRTAIEKNLSAVDTAR